MIDQSPVRSRSPANFNFAYLFTWDFRGRKCICIVTEARSLASRSGATKQFTIPLDVAPMTDRWCNGTATIEVTEAKKNSVRLRQRSLKNAIMIEISLSGPFAVFESSSTRAGMPRYITRRLYRKSPKVYFNHPRRILVFSSKFASHRSPRVKTPRGPFAKGTMATVNIFKMKKLSAIANRLSFLKYVCSILLRISVCEVTSA